MYTIRVIYSNGTYWNVGAVSSAEAAASWATAARTQEWDPTSVIELTFQGRAANPLEDAPAPVVTHI